jgi:broad specificity phosphatase PhoE
MKVIDNLPADLTTKKIAWVIRHAQRLDNLDQLSEQGRQDALNFGKKIKDLPINAIYSSPQERCVDTARLISTALDRDIPIILDNTIAEVGVYVTNMEEALETYHTLGKDEFFRRLLTNEKLPGYNQFQHAGKVISDFIKNNTVEPGITLFITHNFIIRMLNHYIRGLSYTDKLLKVNPLEGIIIEIN